MYDVGERIPNVPFDLARRHTRQRLNDTELGTYCKLIPTRLAEEPQQCVIADGHVFPKQQTALV